MLLLAHKVAVSLVAGLLGLATLSGLNTRPKFVHEPDGFVRLTFAGKTISFSRFEVSRQEWKACAEAGICAGDLKALRNGDGLELPMTGIDYFDAQNFITWASKTSGHHYRLPTLDEWQAAAIDVPKPVVKKLFEDPRLAWAADYGSMPVQSPVLRPRGGFGTEANGVADLRGNVWEWTSACVVASDKEDECPAFYVAGAHIAELPEFLREPAIGGCAAGVPPSHLGLRLVEDVEIRNSGLGY